MINIELGTDKTETTNRAADRHIAKDRGHPLIEDRDPPAGRNHALPDVGVDLLLISVTAVMIKTIEVAGDTREVAVLNRGITSQTVMIGIKMTTSAGVTTNTVQRGDQIINR